MLIWEPGQPIPPIDFSIRIAAKGFIDPESHDPMMYDRLAAALDGIHNVVVSCHPDRRGAWTHALKGACVQSEILMPELQSLAPLAVNKHGPMRHWSYRTVRSILLIVTSSAFSI